MKLSDKTLGDLPQTVLRPRSKRGKLTPGIVHIGVGNFHRAHQSWYLHRLMQEGRNLDWAIVGAGVRGNDEAMRERLRAQDFMTTLIELDPAGKAVEVVGSMSGFVPVTNGHAALIEAMCDPAIRIVSLTVTEGGYFIDPVSKSFDSEHADIRHDAASPATPRTAFGAIVEALRRRRDAGTGPVTLQSCDNLQGNGAILKDTVTSLAGLSDPALAAWIGNHCSFPNSMVDCIVPATGKAELDLVRSFGIEDEAPVTHENFRQWVIEDDFCAGRPEWEQVGATFTNAVHDYERMKIRILNGGHQLLANAGELLSVETIAGCMADADIAGFFERTEREEIAPHVEAVPDMTPSAYVELIARRFANPSILDTTRRVAFDGSSRHTGFLLPVLRDGLASGAPVEGLALAEALWARMCDGRREDGSLIEENDPFWDDLVPVARAARERPRAWLEQRHVYGDLADARPFADAFERWLGMIWQNGTRAALQHHAGNE
ncbi:MAG: mannitol dehydrogenase family protein [Geminicoccaceae bacterium]